MNAKEYFKELQVIASSGGYLLNRMKEAGFGKEEIMLQLNSSSYYESVDKTQYCLKKRQKRKEQRRLNNKTK